MFVHKVPAYLFSESVYAMSLLCLAQSGGLETDTKRVSISGVEGRKRITYVTAASSLLACAAVTRTIVVKKNLNIVSVWVCRFFY